MRSKAGRSGSARRRARLLQRRNARTTPKFGSFNLAPLRSSSPSTAAAAPIVAGARPGSCLSPSGGDAAAWPRTWCGQTEGEPNLALWTLSKPIASRLKRQAAVHPKFRNFIIAIAQVNHRITTKIQRRIYGHVTDVEIRPLDEQKTVQAATDLIGEAFIFSVTVAALIFEVQRCARSEARKEEARKQELEIVSST